LRESSSPSASDRSIGANGEQPRSVTPRSSVRSVFHRERQRSNGFIWNAFERRRSIEASWISRLEDRREMKDAENRRLDARITDPRDSWNHIIERREGKTRVVTGGNDAAATHPDCCQAACQDIVEPAVHVTGRSVHSRASHKGSAEFHVTHCEPAYLCTRRPGA